MARTVEECLALASAARAAAAAESLENVRRVHLEAAASWESLAQSARYVEFPSEESASRPAPSQPPGHASEIRLGRALGKTPAVAPPACERDPSIGDALITGRHAETNGHAAAGPVPPSDGAGIILYDTDGNLRTLEEIEADVIRLAIDVYRGRMAEVARRLGIGRSTLYRKLNDFGIDSSNRPDGTMGL